MANSPFLLDTYASAYQIFMTLLQKQEDTEPTTWVTIGYWHQSLTDVELRY